ncbi:MULTISPECIES: hypothetical protein [unclassified Nocardia]|uniref:hypothetical protein n=1 Tax=unclassified Nocardia TaxID=2637762 RepID=UPI00278C2A1C|nr:MULTISPECIES: hypothetical protein [unclassified Nocardia]
MSEDEPATVGSNIQASITAIDGKQPEFDSLSTKVEDSYNSAIKWASAGAAAGGTLLLGPFGGLISGAVAYDYLETDRDRIVKLIKLALDGDPEKGIPGLVTFMNWYNFPVKLIEIGDTWRSIAGEVVKGYNESNDQTKLSAHWQSPGAREYGDARERQHAGFVAVEKVCIDIAEQLEQIARDVRNYYTELSENVLELVEAVTVTIASCNPATLIASTDSFVNGIAGIQQSINSAIQSIKTASESVQISLNIMNQTTVQRGLPSQQWPTADTDRYDDASGWSIIALDGGYR